MTKIGVIGTGGITGVHLQNLKSIEGVEIASLCDVSEKALASRKEIFGGKTYTDFHEMVKRREKLDGVLVCTPPAVRYEPIAACVRKGIPVFVEKPPAVTLEEAERIRQLLERHDHPHFVGFVFRWATFMDPVLKAVRDRQIYGIQSHYFADMMFPEARGRCATAYYDKTLSGGMVGDQALHIIDLIRFLTRAEARLVSAFGNNFLCPKGPGITTEETVAIQMQLEDEVVVNHLHTWAFPRWEIAMQVFGQGFNLNINLGESLVTGQMNGEEIESRQEAQLHKPIMEAFVNFVRTGDRGLVKSDYADALKTQRLTFAVDQSIVKGEMLDLRD